MAYEQNFQDHTAQFESQGDVSLKHRWESISRPRASENVNGCFDCNICLDSAHDPVVTLCGHLYCWPCIYKWLHVQTSDDESTEPPKCPVCKAKISQSSLVPLYGRGNSLSESNAKLPHRDVAIPHRPPAVGANTLIPAATSATSHENQHIHTHPFPSHPHPYQHHPFPSHPYPFQHHTLQTHPHPFQHQQYFPPPYGNYAAMTPPPPPPPPPYFGGTAMMGIFPTVGMVGEMVFGRMFGSSDTSLFAYPYSNNTYPFIGNGSHRMRRQEMQIDKSLNRVCIFLFCCFLLCFIVF